MTDPNVERLRALTAQWKTQNFRDLGKAWRRGEVDLSPFLAPEVTYEDDAMPDHIGETFRGHEGMIRALESLSEAFEELTLELERIVGSGDHLVSIHRLRAKATHTGIEFEEPIAYLWAFLEGRVVGVRGFRDPDEALEAAGLRE
jgi:ketosteroid isomerase-like protein